MNSPDCARICKRKDDDSMFIIPNGMFPKADPNSAPGETVTDKITLSDGATIDNTDESIKAYHERNKRNMQAIYQQERQRQQARETGKRCPFHHDAYVNQNIPCQKDCALFCGDSCALAAYPGKVNTAGKSCPFRRKCDDSCALYKGAGCSLTNFATMAERI